MSAPGEDEAATPPPPPPLDAQLMDEAAAGKPSNGVGDAPSSPPSFRMEDLPVEIQTVVMSLLPLKEAVRASIVSTSWSMLWTLHVNLCFIGPNDPDFEDDMDYITDDQYIDDLVKIERAKFIDSVNGIIQRHSGIGINKFSIRCALGLPKEDLGHLHRWIAFAASSKASIIEFDLKKMHWASKEAVHHFPLEALDVQGNSCLQSLLLADVSIKLHSGICGFAMLKRFVLEHVQIFGDFPGLLASCSALEDLAIIDCPGRAIPIVLHGCSKLEKATILFICDKGLGNAFTLVPSILLVKILNVEAVIIRYEQLQKLTTGPHGMFMHLRHMTCRLNVLNGSENADNGVLQLAYCLDIAPQLETLHLDVSVICRFRIQIDRPHVFIICILDILDSLHYFLTNLLRALECRCFIRALRINNRCDEVVGEEGGPDMRRHDHLKTVYISGFRLYKAQTKLACCILAKASVLEHLKLEPRFAVGIGSRPNDGLESVMPEVCKWARLASKHFGKVVTVSGAPSE